MTKEKSLAYKKAYVELYELIKLLTKQEQEKIPNDFIEYIINNKDTEYRFIIDKSKGILEQDYITETKALIVKMYEKYLAPEEENEFWKRYDRICLNMIEQDKENKFNSNDIFKNEKPIKNEKKQCEFTIINNLPVEVKKENIIEKLINLVKKFLRHEKN